METSEIIYHPCSHEAAIIVHPFLGALTTTLEVVVMVVILQLCPGVVCD